MAKMEKSPSKDRQEQNSNMSFSFYKDEKEKNLRNLLRLKSKKIFSELDKACKDRLLLPSSSVSKDRNKILNECQEQCLKHKNEIKNKFKITK